MTDICTFSGIERDNKYHHRIHECANQRHHWKMFNALLKLHNRGIKLKGQARGTFVTSSRLIVFWGRKEFKFIFHSVHQVRFSIVDWYPEQ